MSEAAATLAPGESTPKSSAWPIVMFFGIILGAPWLIWKLIRSFSDGTDAGSGWGNGGEDHFVARAEYDFRGMGNEISFTAGQMINIAPKDLQPRVKGWLLGCVDGKTEGMLPANYVKVLGKRRGRKYQTEVLPGGESPAPAPAPITPSASASSLSDNMSAPAPITPSASVTSLSVDTPASTEAPPENELDNMFQEAGSSPAEMAASDILDSCGSASAESSDSCSSQTVPKKTCCSEKKT